MAENIVEMNNGCICCTVRGDLIVGLKKLFKQTSGKGKPLDGIIIETTGLADPSPVAQTFFADEFVQSKFRLDGILTVVDAKHIVPHLREEKPDGAVNEAVEQIAFADRILLNKTDLVSPEEATNVEGEIRQINKNARIRKTTKSVVDMDFIMGIKAFSLDKVLEDVNEDFLQTIEHGHGDGGHGHDGGHGGHGEGHGGGHGGGHGEGHGSGHGEGHGGAHVSGHGAAAKTVHMHDYRVGSIGIVRPGREVDRMKLDAFLMWLMKEKGTDLYRSKGVLAIRGMPNKFVFHAVHMQFGDSQGGPWGADEQKVCKMVFIGKNLDREELNRKFNECLCPP